MWAEQLPLAAGPVHWPCENMQPGSATFECSQLTGSVSEQEAVGVRLTGASESLESLIGMLVHIIAQISRPLKATSLDRIEGPGLCSLAAKLLNTMLDLLGMPLI